MLQQLNKEFNIEKQGVFYIDVEENTIIAENDYDLMVFYYDTFKYKKEMCFDGETETIEHYETILNELIVLMDNYE